MTHTSTEQPSLTAIIRDLREIKSIEELAQVIYDDLNLSEKEKS